jgi:adenosylcobinamide kinase / adenosylcobinamide-phosphate guanylyltransferase
MGQLILVTGGARSGKSSFAEKLAASFGREVVYLATAQALDTEMEQRITQHRLSRPAEWRTVEEPLEVPGAVLSEGDGKKVILLDCITLWLTNLLILELENDQAGDVEQKIQNKLSELIEVIDRQDTILICVSNEVGCGVVPENELARLYRDLAGRANQRLGRAAQQVYLVTAGYPIEVKQQGAKILRELEGDR